MMTGNDVTGHVYVWNSTTHKFELSENKLTLPEGYYITAGPKSR
jgi:hypothetical protein